MNKTLLVIGLAAAMTSTSSFAANVYGDFQIQESAVPGAAANLVDADYLNGSYNEVFTVYNGVSGLEFSTQAYASFTALLKNDGTVAAPSQLGDGLFGANNQYRIYGLFDAVGTVSNAGGEAQFNGTSGNFSLFIDTNSNTTFSLGANGFTAPTLGNNGDDFMIAYSSSLLSLENIINPVGSLGAFDLYFDNFTLTSGDQNASLAGDQNGENYFIAPVPFHLITNVSGDFNDIAPAPGTFTTNGDVSAIFTVPEPDSLALLGLGFTGMGFSSIRRRKQA